MSAKNDRFKKLYEFYGIHGEYMHALTSPSDDKGPALFSSGIELFRCAAVVGVLFDKKEKPCPKNNGKSFTIRAHQFTSRWDYLYFLLRIVILNADSEIPNDSERVNRAFRNPDFDDNFSLFEEYRLGGLTYLYNYFYSSSLTTTSVDERLDIIKQLLDSTKPSTDEEVDDFVEEDNNPSTDPLI